MLRFSCERRGMRGGGWLRPPQKNPALAGSVVGETYAVVVYDNYVTRFLLLQKYEIFSIIN
jgi:hypothetical protein